MVCVQVIIILEQGNLVVLEEGRVSPGSVPCVLGSAGRCCAHFDDLSLSNLF